MTVLQLMKGSLRLIGSLGVGRGIEAAGSISADCLFALNALRDSWNLERLVIQRVVEASFTWPASTSSRTIGPTGNFVTTRPLRIEGAVFITGESRAGIEILTRELWSAGDSGLFIDPSLPNATLYLRPAPSTDQTLALATWEPIAAFAAATDTIALPPGYERALLYNLALELAPQFPDSKLTQLVIDTARDSKATIKRFNSVTPQMSYDNALVGLGGFDINTGTYR